MCLQWRIQLSKFFALPSFVVPFSSRHLHFNTIYFDNRSRKGKNDYLQFLLL
ncbi:hypothetical protein Syun_014741 [Stephania yunnanensis]|uniref:Uncharacterized protein n=1 Tax=Stephania yunnanensis TaxID=152371 RepID=A0AAP0JJW5_9MAGN